MENNKSNDMPWMIIGIAVMVIFLFGAAFYMGENYGRNKYEKDNEADIKKYMSEWDENLERIVLELEQVNDKAVSVESKLDELKQKIDVIDERSQEQKVEEPPASGE